MTDRVFGWAVIGAGAIANTVMNEGVRSGRHRVVSVYSRTKSKAEKFASKYRAKAVDSLDTAVTMDGVDAVYLATPHSCHYQEILECIRLGVPVLSEKAFTINSRQVKAIIDSDRHSYVSEAMWTRYNPITKEVRRIVESNELGNIKSVKASFCYDRRLSGFTDRVVRLDAGGGALLDIGVYLVSYMVMLFGKPQSIEATAKFNREGSDNSDDITLTYEGGLTCHLKASFSHLSTCSIKIEGDKGSISMPLFYRPIFAKVKAGGKTRYLKTKAGYIHELDGVRDDILTGKSESSVIPLKDSLAVMEVLDDIRSIIHLKYGDNIENI